MLFQQPTLCCQMTANKWVLHAFFGTSQPHSFAAHAMLQGSVGRCPCDVKVMIAQCHCDWQGTKCMPSLLPSLAPGHK